MPPEGWSYDRTLPTQRDQLRLYIPDTDGNNPILCDAELDFLLTDNDNDIRYAAATALEIIAADQALVLKVISLLDVDTDGTKVAASLMARADKLRADALRKEDETDGGFDYAEMVLDDFSWRERMLHEIQR